MLIFLPVLRVSTRARAYVCTHVVPVRARVCRMVWACGAQAQLWLCRQHPGPGVRVAHSLCRASPPRTPSGPSEPTCRALWDPPTHTGAGGGSQSDTGRLGLLGTPYEPRADGPTKAALSCWPWSALETPLLEQPGGRGPRHTGVGLKASVAVAPQVPAGTVLGRKRSRCPPRPQHLQRTPPPSWASRCCEGGGVSLPSSPPSPAHRSPQPERPQLTK